jgi:hypothetical protein
MQRDIEALQQLYLHRAMSSRQFAALGFHNCGYETARKRVRKLIKYGYLGVTSRRHSLGRGRPEQIYFVTETGAEALKASPHPVVESVATGLPHSYLKDHCLKVAEIHLALYRAQQEGIVHNLQWTAGWQLQSNGSQSDRPDAVVSFETVVPGSRHNHATAGDLTQKVTAAIIIDTGNLRQTRHWEPKLHFLLGTVPTIWIITSTTIRILTLRKWTLPVIDAYGAEPRHCVFSVYDDLMDSSIFNARWVDVHGNVASPIATPSYCDSALNSFGEPLRNHYAPSYNLE